ncbi:translation initiation factor IF-2-like [Manacus candei]|uniref:translation initiation factor IF-2-like n=1 Tax=Manacus candei TaxID=415023 RepID=UPI00222604A4|nr:translation initiation factor IF-2-like [Manacus candei]
MLCTSTKRNVVKAMACRRTQRRAWLGLGRRELALGERGWSLGDVAQQGQGPRQLAGGKASPPAPAAAPGPAQGAPARGWALQAGAEPTPWGGLAALALVRPSLSLCACSPQHRLHWAASPDGPCRAAPRGHFPFMSQVPQPVPASPAHCPHPGSVTHSGPWQPKNQSPTPPECSPTHVQGAPKGFPAQSSPSKPLSDRKLGDVTLGCF